MIEAETAEEAQQWMESIREHMMYANRVARESSAILDRRSQTSDKRSSLRFANQSSIAAVSIDESRRYSNIIGHPAVPITKPRSESVDSDDAAPLRHLFNSNIPVYVTNSSLSFFAVQRSTRTLESLPSLWFPAGRCPLPPAATTNKRTPRRLTRSSHISWRH